VRHQWTISLETMDYQLPLVIGVAYIVGSILLVATSVSLYAIVWTMHTGVTFIQRHYEPKDKSRVYTDPPTSTRMNLRKE
jgi:hypothetical protein